MVKMEFEMHLFLFFFERMNQTKIRSPSIKKKKRSLTNSLYISKQSSRNNDDDHF